MGDYRTEGPLPYGRKGHLSGGVGDLDDLRSRLASDVARAHRDRGGSVVLRQIVHDVHEHALADGAQAAGAGAVLHRLVSDGGKGCRLEGEARVLELEHAGVLLDERVLRLHEDADEILLRQLVQGGDNRNAAHELGDHAVLVQVLRQHLLQKLGLGLLLGGGQLAGEAEGRGAHALGHDVGQAHEGAAQDEQDVRRVDGDELLLGVLAAALGRNGGLAALDDFEERLLDALARYVAGDGKVLGLAGDLVDLVDIDDADLGPGHVEIGRADELEQDVLHILAHVSRLGERGGVRDGEGHLQTCGRASGPEASCPSPWGR